jgi:hypothetical protein
MNQPIRKAPRSLYKPRSGVSLGKGSHKPFQSLTEPLIRSVQKADERMAFVHGGCVRVSASRGVAKGVPVQRQSDCLPAGGCWWQSLRQPAHKKRPLAPRPRRSVMGGSPQFFLHFSLCL